MTPRESAGSRRQGLDDEAWDGLIIVLMLGCFAGAMVLDKICETAVDIVKALMGCR